MQRVKSTAPCPMHNCERACRALHHVAHTERRAPLPPAVEAQHATVVVVIHERVHASVAEQPDVLQRLRRDTQTKQWMLQLPSRAASSRTSITLAHARTHA
eukprot:6151111-Pleurochrysis_carterae.AAC.2